MIVFYDVTYEIDTDGKVIFGLTITARRLSARLAGGFAVASVLVAATIVFITRGALVGTLINDITTDTVDPPAFNAVIALRPPGSNPVEYGGAAVAARQAELYGDIRPVQSSLRAADAHNRALGIARGMGWEIVASDSGTGIIEAVDTTRLFRFKDDVVIRVTSTAQGSRVDIRSRSRVGRSDLGKNAARIREFIRRFSS